MHHAGSSSSATKRAPKRGERLPLPASPPGAQPERAIEILSHELRSPITTIHLGTKVLRLAGRRISRPVRDEVVEAVEVEAERLHRLVEDLLAVARHEGDDTRLPVRPLLIQHWLPDVLANEIAANAGLRVRTHIVPDLPPVLADDASLVQVVRNVLANAARYAAKGMPVEVVAEAVPEGVRQAVAGTPLGRRVLLRFLDRGPGLAADETERLFEAFYRSPRTAAWGSAAGLGLTAAQGLLRAMGGDIVARPRDGGGAEFVVALPMAIADEDVPGAGSRTPQGPAS